MIVVSTFLLLVAKPVIELEDMMIEGEVRRPPVVEVRPNSLQDAIDKAALSNLIRLEKKLLESKDFETYKKDRDDSESP